ncbi:MAG: CAP domain-containing protein [Patescibacteria group bacterium]
MLKRITTILAVLILGGWGISQYVSSNTGTKVYQVFSQFRSLPPVKEEPNINNADIIEATNKERVSAGLPPLSTNVKLGVSAQMKVDDMIARQYFEHASPTGEGVSDLGAKAGYQYVIMGENLALGNFTSSNDIVDAWMKSPGHKANILNKRYQEIGVSVELGMYEGKEVWFAVQHFGTSRSVCPNIDTNLKSSISTLNTELKVEEGIISALKEALETPGAQSEPSYEKNVALFNDKVEAYNTKLATSREKIGFYNKQVRTFNTCIATFQ